MKFNKPFRGVPDGEIYPVDYEAGAECPPELEAGARSLGAIGKRAIAPTPAPAAAPAVHTSAQSDDASADEPAAGAVDAATGADDPPV